MFSITKTVEKYPEMQREEYRNKFSTDAQNAPKGHVLDISEKGNKVSGEYVLRSVVWLQ